MLQDRPRPRKRPPIQRFEKQIQLRLYLNNPTRILSLITRLSHPRTLNSSQKLHLPGSNMRNATAGQRLANGRA
jgi:hypothetical protein